jgi:hypothetical protein
MNNIIVGYVGEDVAVWITGDVTMTRATGDITTTAIVITYVTATRTERYTKTAADGTVECLKVIIRFTYIDMVRRDTI